MRMMCATAVVVSLIVIMLGPRPASAHNGEPAPQPPPPPIEVAPLETVDVYPLRWSWVHWWEANRDAYLHHTFQGHEEQDASGESLDQLRADTVAALRKALESDMPVLRSAAAVALGRIGTAADLDRLRPLAENDPAGDVRQWAIVAIGLLRDDAGQTTLLGMNYATAYLQTVGINSIGLGATLTEPAHERVRQWITDRSPYLSVAAGRCLSRHALPGAGDAAGIKRLIAQTNNPWLASELILSCARVKDEQLHGLLGDIVLATDRAEALPVWRELVRIDGEKRMREGVRPGVGQAGGESRFLRYRAAHERFQQLEPIPPGLEIDDPRREHPRMLMGVERVYLSRLRGSAAIALGMIDAESSVTPLVKLLDAREDEWNVLPRGFAAIAVGQLRAREGVTRLIALLEPRLENRAKTQEELDSPTRGLAAIALGLYLRADPGAPQQGEPFAVPQVTELLRQRLLDEREKPEVRSASAVALGLSLSNANLEVLARVSPTIDVEREQVLLGYVMLARGMLGDETIIEPAARFLDVRNDRTDPAGLLSRRAVVLALGLTRSRAAVPVLTDAWHLNFYANREVIVALSLMGARFAAVDVLDRLRSSGDAQEQAFMAALLGELLDDRRPPALAGLIAGTNYTMKNPQRLALQRLANVFLFDYLIPSFDEEWY